MHNFACFFYGFSITTAASSLILLCLALLNMFILVSQHKLLNCVFFWLADSCENNYCFVKYTTKSTVYQLLQLNMKEKARAMELHWESSLALIIVQGNCDSESCSWPRAADDCGQRQRLSGTLQYYLGCLRWSLWHLAFPQTDGNLSRLPTI